MRIIRDAAEKIEGNARACVFLEPLFVIPNTMYSGYMTLYMMEFGITKTQVGFVTSLNLAVALFFALISAYITDKLGRRRSTLVFDSIGWGLAQLVWAFAVNINFFIVAAILNAFGRVVMNSWHCLMLEDSPPDTRIHIFTFIQVASLIGGFFAPAGALLINRLTLVPAMRVMMIFATLSMFALFFVRNKYVAETGIGRQKMCEMKGVSVWDVFRSYMPALKRLLKDRLLLLALFIRSLNFIQLTIRTAFIAVLVTERLGFPAEVMAVFQLITAVVMLITLLFISPALARHTGRWPISLGLWFHIGATAVLLLSPPSQNYPLLILSAVLTAFGTSVATPRIDTLFANIIVNEDRSVVNALTSVILLLISTPFGYIGGALSGIDARLPFIFTGALFLICLLLLRVTTNMEKRRDFRQCVD